MSLSHLDVASAIKFTQSFDAERRPIDKTFPVVIANEDFFLKRYVPAHTATFQSDFFGEVASYILGTFLDVPMPPKALSWEGLSFDLPPTLRDALGIQSEAGWVGLWATQRVEALVKPTYHHDEIEHALIELLEGQDYRRIIAFDLFVANVDARPSNILLSPNGLACAFDNERAFANCTDWSKLPICRKDIPPSSIPSSVASRRQFAQTIVAEVRGLCAIYSARRHEIRAALLGGVRNDWVPHAIEFLDFRAENLPDLLSQRLA